MGNLYKCAGPTMGLLQHFFGKKSNARQMPGGGCTRLELTEPLMSAKKPTSVTSRLLFYYFLHCQSF